MVILGQQSHAHFISGGRLVEEPGQQPTPEDTTIRTWVDEYVEPVRYRLSFYNPDAIGPPIMVFDPFKDNIEDNPFVLTDVDITQAPGQTGTFSFKISDDERVIDMNQIHNGCVVQIEGGKSPETYKNRAYGIIYGMQPQRQGTGLLDWVFQGNGFGNILNYTLTDFIKSAKRVGPGSTTPDPTDPLMQISNLVKDLLSSREILVADNGYSIADSYQLDISEIEDRITEILPGITLPRTLASAVIDQLMAASGGIFWIDANKKVKAQYPSHKHSGITIKDVVLDDDRGDVISYPMAAWNANYSITPGEFANEVILDVTIPQVTPIAQAPDVKSYESLANKDLMVQFIPGAARLTNLGLTLSKTGLGHDSADDAMGKTGVQGLIVADNGFDLPSTNIIATLNIPYEDISTNQAVVFKLNLNFETDNINPNAKHWLILRRSGSTEEATIQWYHDNDDETPSTDAVPRRIGLKTNPSLQTLPQYKVSDFNKNWAKSNDGPVFSYSFFANAQVTLVMQAPESVQRFTPRRPIQSLLFAPWITDSVSGLLYMSAVLNRLSKEKQVFTINEVSIPNNQIESGELCFLSDYMLGLDNALVEIAGVHESASASDLFNPLGRNTCDVSLIRHIDPIEVEEEDIIAPCSGGVPQVLLQSQFASTRIGQQGHRSFIGGWA